MSRASLAGPSRTKRVSLVPSTMADRPIAAAAAEGGGSRFVVSSGKRNVTAGVAASWQAAPIHEQPPASILIGSLAGTVICPRQDVDG